jgi:hypothetical protein
MNAFLEKVEKINSKLIIPALILLFLIIIFELFVHVENPTFLLIIHIIDYVVIAIFVIDLIIIWDKTRNIKFFFKNNWLDIIAIFPFGIFFRAISRTYRLAIEAERIALSQAVIHEISRTEKFIKIFAESERLAKGIRIITRSLRVITKSRLFEKFYATFHSKDESYNTADR